MGTLKRIVCEPGDRTKAPRTRRLQTKDLYNNDWFLGDHIPGGGIDLTCWWLRTVCVLAAYPAVLATAHGEPDRPPRVGEDQGKNC